MAIDHPSILAAEIRKLKRIGLTDKQVADELEIKTSRVNYIRSKYGIGGRYELASRALSRV